MSEDREVTRFGIIGCGRIATSAVAPAIRWAKNARLQAIGSRELSVAEDRAQTLEAARAYGSYQAVLEDPQVDAVYIGLPNHLHVEWARRALLAGKHVLCEKSLTDDPAAALSLAEDARTHGLRLIEAFMYRHHPQWTLVRNLLDEGAIGDVQALRIWLAGVMEEDDHRLSDDGGGALFDVTCYGVNAARFLLGKEPGAVSAMAAWKGEVDVSSMATLAFPAGEGAKGVLASVWGSLASSAEEGLVVSGTRGRIEVARPFMPGWDQTELVLYRDGARSLIRAGGANHYLHMVEHFSSLVADPSRERFPAEDGTANAVACDAVREAARTGRWVRVLAPAPATASLRLQA